MPPTTIIPNVLGGIATICWCINLLPQIWRNYQTKSTKGLPASMLLLWAASGTLSGVYALARKFSVALIVQPHCFTVLCSIVWGQCLVYERQLRVQTVTLLLLTVVVTFAATELGLLVALGHARGLQYPVVIIGVLACSLDIAGFFPLPFEILKRRGRVVGLDFAFLAFDWCGFFFSLLAVTTQARFDKLFGIAYALCCIIEMGVAISHLIWMFRTQGIRNRAKDAGKSFDTFEEGIQWQLEGIDLYETLSGYFSRGRAL